MTSLAKRSVHAALWNYAGNATLLLLQFAIGILLARLLGPEAFGLVAIATLLIGLGQLFVDFGLGSALIQARELNDGDIDFMFTIQLVLGGVMTALSIALAKTIAGFFDAPDAAAVIRWIAPMFVLRAAGQTSIALLSRELRFRAVQMGAIAGNIVGYIGFGLPMAVAGYGVWSLVVAQLVQTVMSSIVALAQARYVPRLALRGRRELFGFGRLVISANISSWVILNSGPLIVGHYAGIVPLGLYNRALNLAGTPTGTVVSGLQGVLFAASSRAQDSPEKIRKAVLACIALFIVLVGSVLLAVAATPQTVTLAVYGTKWAGAAPLLTPLALAMLLHGVLAFFGPALLGLGHVDKEVRAQWPVVLLMVPLLVFAASISVEAVAWSVVLAYLLRLALLAFRLHSIVRFGRAEVARAVAPALSIALVSALAGALADQGFSALAVEWRLVVVVGASGMGLAAGLLAMHVPLSRGPLGEFALREGVLPPFLRRWLTPRGRRQDT